MVKEVRERSGQGFDGGQSGILGTLAVVVVRVAGYGRDGTVYNTRLHGGDGKQSTITGFTSYWFAGGGGGAGHSSSGGNGGRGGGGGGA